MSRAMETRVLVVDVSQAMGADLAVAKRSLMSLAQKKIIEVPCCSPSAARERLRSHLCAALLLPVPRRRRRPASLPCPAVVWLMRMPSEQMGSKTKMGLVMIGTTGEHPPMVHQAAARLFGQHLRKQLGCALGCVLVAKWDPVVMLLCRGLVTFSSGSRAQTPTTR